MTNIRFVHCLGLLIEQFLDENRSQLTHYGILQLKQTMRDNQLAVFFRNNHFSTIWKNQVGSLRIFRKFTYHSVPF